MSRRGRPPLAEPRVAWKLYIRSTLAAEVELLLLDPMREKIKYGERNRLVEELLEAWIAERRKNVPAQQGTSNVPEIPLGA